MDAHHSLPSLPGASLITLRSVGLIVTLVAILALGKAACCSSGTVRHADHVDHTGISYSGVASRSQETLTLASSVDLSSPDEEHEAALSQTFHELFPSRGRSRTADSSPIFHRDPNHDIHLTGSQFDVDFDGLPDARMPPFAYPPTSPVGDAADADEAGRGKTQLGELRPIVDSSCDTGFDFTCNGPIDHDNVSVASMAVLIDQDEIQKRL